MSECKKDCKTCKLNPCPNRKTNYDEVSFDLNGLKPEESKFVNSMFKYLQIGFYASTLIVISTIGAISTYWMLEPDPLVIKYTDNGTKWSKCDNRRYSFDRYVYTSKDVDISVQERYYDLDGMEDMNKIQSERVYPTDVRYQLGEGFEKNMTFKKDLPIDLPVGRFEYRPWARYRVNPMKEIYRPLPIQRIEITCQYELEKHGVMK
jgi:hypothetical protein